MYVIISLLSRLRVVDNTQPLVTVEGFANYSDVQVPDLVPWTPLKAGEGLLSEYAEFH